MSRIIAFTALHYGLEYIQAAIRSVQHAVDQWVFCYSPVGSHGAHTTAQCPESERQLLEAVREALTVPYTWHKGIWPYEGAQRDTVFSLEPDADLIIVVDSDEIWAPGGVEVAIEEGLKMNARWGRAQMWHFWRSFQYFCTDPSMPVRVVNPRIGGGEAYLPVPPVFHMGYAQRQDIVRYKINVHGHRSEWRPDWLAMYEAWTPQRGPWEDVHPTNRDFWTVKPFAREQLPPLLREHPYYGVEVIR